MIAHPTLRRVAQASVDAGAGFRQVLATVQRVR